MRIDSQEIYTLITLSRGISIAEPYQLHTKKMPSFASPSFLICYYNKANYRNQTLFRILTSGVLWYFHILTSLFQLDSLTYIGKLISSLYTHIIEELILYLLYSSVSISFKCIHLAPCWSLWLEFTSYKYWRFQLHFICFLYVSIPNGIYLGICIGRVGRVYNLYFIGHVTELGLTRLK